MNLLDFLFPKRCVGCGSLGRYLCNRCSGTIQYAQQICPMCEKPAIDGVTHPRCKTRYSIDGVTSFFRYDGVVKKAIKSLKYRFVSDLSSEFVVLMTRSSFFDRTNDLNSKLLHATLVPIPLHPSRLRERGFNQAEVIGRIIASKVDSGKDGYLEENP